MLSEFEQLRVGYIKGKRVKCPNCAMIVRNDNLSKHMKTEKCVCKCQYKTREEHNKERVRCTRCKAEVCKNKLRRHMRTLACRTFF